MVVKKRAVEANTNPSRTPQKGNREGRERKGRGL